MIFGWFTIGFAWSSIVLFVGLVAFRFYRIASMPLNLRWEVYPVPHEMGEKGNCGGSYMEEVDWSKKPRSTSFTAELMEMGAEIFTLKRVREHNPYHIWPFSMAMHWGLYLLLLWIGLLGVLNIVPVLASLTVLVGTAALLMGCFGTVGLIVKRTTNRELKLYTAPVDYFNLIFLSAIFGIGLLSWVLDPTFSGHQAYIKGLLSFTPTTVSPVVTSMFFGFQAFAIYMPFSKLIHYVMKHFTFTEILWNDEFNHKGSNEDKQIEHQLSYKVGWAGPHITQGATWLEDVNRTTAGEEGPK